MAQMKEKKTETIKERKLAISLQRLSPSLFVSSKLSVKPVMAQRHL